MRIRVAIIDSGLYNNSVLEHKICDKIIFVPKCRYKTDSTLQDTSHGTSCAQIIAEVCPDATFLDLTAVDVDGTTAISHLLKALDWCISQKIKLIHLSLGTVNFFDIQPLTVRVNALVEQGAVIVAAYHNLNIKSYPAALPKVFGVRQDRDGVLAEGQFFIQDMPNADKDGLGLKRENRIVAHWWGKDGMERANSYAAPVITGYVAKLLSSNNQFGFSDVLHHLIKNSKPNIQYSQCLHSLITKRAAIADMSIPIIACASFSSEDSKILMEAFKAKGYHAILLQERVTMAESIPLGYYGRWGLSLIKLLYTVELVYQPDIIILDFLTKQMYGITEKQEVDMFIFFGRGTYQISFKGILENVETVKAAADRILFYFT